MSLAVFDIDGVVADVRHRVHLVERRPRDWPGFFAAADADLPSDTGIGWALRAAEQHELAWLTGRPEWLRTVTADWLRRLAADDEIAVFVDDDPQVVSAAAAAGFTASLATWLPRGRALADAQERAGRS